MDIIRSNLSIFENLSILSSKLFMYEKYYIFVFVISPGSSSRVWNHDLLIACRTGSSCVPSKTQIISKKKSISKLNQLLCMNVLRSFQPRIKGRDIWDFFGKINRFSQSISESVGLLIKAAIRYASHKIITIFSLWSLFKRTNSHPHLDKSVSPKKQKYYFLVQAYSN